jgi:peptide chain release factor 1
MFERLDQIEARYDELTQALASPEIMNDSARYQKTAKAHAEISAIVEKYREYKDLKKGIADSKAVLADEKDPEMRAYAQEELDKLEARVAGIEEELKVLLLPKDPNDEKDVILEIRAGTGGDEATLFAAEMFRMYTRYAETQGWKVEVLSTSESGVGGLKEVIALIEGQRVYSRLKYESGVHRVQRVPATEQQGRVHTSAVTVAVLPEAEDVDIKIEAKDLRIDTFCSSGPGGQSVNTTYSAVRITHIPTNTVVSCQDEKSQIKNREKGMRVLRSRLYEMEMQKQQDALAKERKAMVGSGDRSEKIRTYNFPQNRVTDHRIGLTIHQLAEVMDGKLQPIVDALVTHYQAEKMKQETNNGIAKKARVRVQRDGDWIEGEAAMNGAGPELRTAKAGKTPLTPDDALEIFENGRWAPIPYEKLRSRLAT